MKVHVVSINTNYRNINNINQKAVEQSNAKPLNNSHPSYMSPPLNISFKGFSYTAPPPITQIGKMFGLHCPHCDIEMIPTTLVREIVQMGHGKNPVQYTRDAINTMRHYTSNMQPLNKEVFLQIKSLHKQDPTQSFFEIMQALRPEPLKRLTQVQTQTLREMGSVSQNLPDKDRSVILDLLRTTSTIVKNNNPEYRFKRGAFLKELERSFSNMELTETTDELHKLALSIPSSGRSVDAFIVKYGGKIKSRSGNYPTNQEIMFRNTEIAKRLLEDSVITLDHIQSRDSFKVYGPEVGKRQVSKLENCGLLCKDCNQSKGNLSLPDEIKKQTELHGRDIPRLYQQFFDQIITAINNGRLQHCEEYPALMKKTFYEQSAGLVDIDISALKKKRQIVLHNQGFESKFA